MSRASTMKNWRCPKCSAEIKALASAVSHRCPSNKSLMTSWELAEEEEK